MNCLFENCENKAYFNYAGKKIPIFCWLHKLKNMIEIKMQK